MTSIRVVVLVFLSLIIGTAYLASIAYSQECETIQRHNNVVFYAKD